MNFKKKDKTNLKNKSRNNLDLRYEEMTKHPVSRLVTRLAIPTMVSMIVMALYNMADTFFVGKISTAATGAVGVVFPLMMTMQALGLTLGVGSGSYVARLLGRKAEKEAQAAVSTAFFTALALGLLLGFFGLIFSAPLMRILGSTDTILPQAMEYANIILLGAPIMAASFVMNVNLRSEGSAFLAMVGLVSGAVINVGLDPLFIFTFKMGVAGAALATVISQLISFSILASHYLTRRSTLFISWRCIQLRKDLYWEFFRSGLPTLSRMMLGTIAVIVLNTTARNYGDPAIAAMTIVNRIMMFIMSLLIGFGQGFQPVAAFNYSAGKHERVLQAFKFTTRVGTSALLVCGIFTALFAGKVIAFFRNDPAVIAVGILALQLQAISMPLNAFSTITNMMFQYTGQPWKATLLAASRQGFVLIPSVILMSHIFLLEGLQSSQALADVITLALAIPFAFPALARLKSASLDLENFEAESSSKKALA